MTRLVPARRRGYRFVAFVWLLACALAAVACDKMPLTAPNGSSITLTSNATIVPLNGTADITALVIEEAGTPVHNGTLVTFTTTVGTLEPAEARTHNGSATVKLHAGSRSGRATIRAFSGDATSESGDDAEGEFVIDIGAASAGRVSLTASPTSVPPTGGTVALLATVFDTGGNRLAGVNVSFTTTAGTLGAATVATDSNGEARTTLTTNRDAEITATASGPVEGIEPGTANVVVSPPPTVTVAGPTAAVPTGMAVLFNVNAAATAPAAISSVSINFGDGRSLNLGAITSTSVAHVYNNPGTFTVTVTATDTNGARVDARTTVVVTESAPPLVSLTASAPSVTTGTVVTFTVGVTAQGGVTPIVQSVSFDFGDGQTSPAQASLTRTHAYGITGILTVTATVRFTDGTTRVAQVVIQIT